MAPLIGKKAKVAQLVERNLAKVKVAGSRPVFRSEGSPHRAFFMMCSSGAQMPRWWNGIHEGLKILCLYGLAGSNPARGTKSD
jgi:hypothetical protein